MSIEKITSKIENDARASAQVTIDTAKQQAWDVVREANEKADKLIAQAEQDGLDAKEKQIVRRKSVAAIDGRNVILAKKQGLIDECFRAAIDKIVGGDRDKYIDFLISTIKAQGIKEGEICLSASDQPLAETLLKKLAEAIPGSGFTVSKDAQNIKGGLLVKVGSTIYNASIEAIAKDIRNDIGAEVASVLFNAQEN